MCNWVWSTLLLCVVGVLDGKTYANKPFGIWCVSAILSLDILMSDFKDGESNSQT